MNRGETREENSPIDPVFDAREISRSSDEPGGDDNRRPDIR